MGFVPTDETLTFQQNLNVYSFISITLGFLSMLGGWLLPSDILFIVGMIGAVLGLGLKTIHLVIRVKDKKQKEKLV